MKNSVRPLFLASILFFTSPAAALDLDRPDVKAFINSMVSEHGYDPERLRDILASVEIQPSIIELISKPAEKTLSWAEYRMIFMTRERIEAGAAFWRQHREAFEAVSCATGVPVEIMIGVIGVESYYGRITGGHRVLDALATLAFDYPPRAPFFRGELEQFLLLIREEDMPAIAAFGSYAGAMGRPQFMPSSYRAYAVDFMGDGKRDIWHDWTDVAGSIANYFVAHGWRSGEQVVAQATLGANWRGPLPKNELSAEDTLASLSKQGVMFATDLPGESAGALLTLEGENGNEYWVGFHNFFVITRYNRSIKYALAVLQLGREVALLVKSNGS